MKEKLTKPMMIKEMKDVREKIEDAIELPIFANYNEQLSTLLSLIADNLKTKSAVTKKEKTVAEVRQDYEQIMNESKNILDEVTNTFMELKVDIYSNDASTNSHFRRAFYSKSSSPEKVKELAENEKAIEELADSGMKLVKDKSIKDVDFHKINEVYTKTYDLFDEYVKQSDFSKDVEISKKIDEGNAIENKEQVMKVAVKRLSELNKFPMSNDLSHFFTEQSESNSVTQQQVLAPFIYYATVAKLKLSKNKKKLILNKQDIQNLDWVCSNAKKNNNFNLNGIPFTSIIGNKDEIINLQNQLLKENEDDQTFIRRLDDHSKMLVNDSYVHSMSVINSNKVAGKYRGAIKHGLILVGTSALMIGGMVLLSAFGPAGNEFVEESMTAGKLASAFVGAASIATTVGATALGWIGDAFYARHDRKRTAKRRKALENNLSKTNALILQLKRNKDKENSNNRFKPISRNRDTYLDSLLDNKDYYELVQSALRSNKYDDSIKLKRNGTYTKVKPVSRKKCLAFLKQIDASIGIDAFNKSNNLQLKYKRNNSNNDNPTKTNIEASKYILTNSSSIYTNNPFRAVIDSICGNITLRDKPLIAFETNGATSGDPIVEDEEVKTEKNTNDEIQVEEIVDEKQADFALSQAKDKINKGFTEFTISLGEAEQAIEAKFDIEGKNISKDLRKNRRKFNKFMDATEKNLSIFAKSNEEKNKFQETINDTVIKVEATKRK